MIVWILCVILILSVIGTLPTWPHSRSWGYKPTAGISVVLLLVLIFIVMEGNGMTGMGHPMVNSSP